MTQKPTAKELESVADYLDGTSGAVLQSRLDCVAAWLRSVADDHLPDATKMIRDQALEDAARIADRQNFGGIHDDDLEWTGCAAHVAAAIRALKGKS